MQQKTIDLLLGREPEPPVQTKSANVLGALIRGTDGGPLSIDLKTAIQASTVLCCARVIAEGLAQVPCKLVRDAAMGGKEEAIDHPLFALLHREPNEWQTSFEFREMVGLHLVLTGNAFVFVNRDSQGRPIELLPYAPASVEIKRDGWETTYTVKTGKSKVALRADQMWHLKGPSLDGYEGLDPVRVARDSIGLALATERFGKALFDNAAMPSGLLSTSEPLTLEQMNELRESWVASLAGANKLKTAVLSGGLQFTALSVAPENAQFLQTRELQIEEICRAFRVLPIMVMHNKNATSYASIEQQMLAHLTHTLAPWFERFEQSAERALLSKDEKAKGFQVKLITRGLLKGSATERAAYYASMRSSGLLTINECREAEDLPRIDDPLADKITPAANLFGTPTTGESGDNNE